MKKFIALIALCFSQNCNSAVNEIPEGLLCAVKHEFSLTIEPSFSKPFGYALCKLERGANAKLVKFKYAQDGTVIYKIIELSSREEMDVVAKFSKALDFPLNDKTRGEDGASWKIESKIYQQFKIRIWSPSVNSEARGYVELVKFKKHLDELLSNAS